MALEMGPSVGDAPWWYTAIVAFIGALGWGVREFLKGRNDAAKPGHYVLEAAEVADMTPVREIGKKLDTLFSRMDMRDERLAESERLIREALEVIRKVEKELEIERRVDEDRRRRDHN